MMTFIAKLNKGIRIVANRLRTQGLRTTLLWIYARGIPRLTGVPMLRFSRVTPQLFVGPQYGKAGKFWLEQNGIHYDVNLRIEFDDAEQGLALRNYCHLPTIDDDAISQEHLAQGAAFIDQAIRSGGKVYIHCAGGIGRAPTLAAAYFISQGMGVEAAYALIRQARPFINPTPSQIDGLVEFARFQGKKAMEQNSPSAGCHAKRERVCP